MTPCSTYNGRAAHWALLCGVIVGKFLQKNNRKNKDRRICKKNNNSVSEKPVGLKNADIDDDAESIASDSDNITFEFLNDFDPKYVWVIARHGKKGGNYDVWSLEELSSSNAQLRTPSNKILRTIPKNVRSKWGCGPIVEEEESPLINGRVNSAGVHFDSDSNDESVDDSTTNRESSTNENMDTTENEHRSPPPFPPPPLPPPPPGISCDEQTEKPTPKPYILPEGPRLSRCLANQYVVFKPLRRPHLVSNLKKEKNDNAWLSNVSFYFI